MKGLILKDLLNFKKSSKFFCLFIILYLGIAIISNNSSFFTGIIIILAAMLPITSLAYDEKSGFSKFALTMPVSKASIVFSKYLLSLIFLCFAIVLSFICNMLIGNLTFYQNLASIALISCISFFSISLSLPLTFKFGIEKGKIITFGVLMLIGLSSTYLSKLISKNKTSLDINGFFELLFNNYLFVIGLLALMIIFFIISSLVSIIIYNKKEF